MPLKCYTYSMEYDRQFIAKFTPEELVKVFGLLAILESNGLITTKRGSTGIEYDLEDYVCDHDFYD